MSAVMISASDPTITENDIPRQTRMFNLTSNNRGLICPFSVTICQEGYCHNCRIHLDGKRNGAGSIEVNTHGGR